MSASPTKQIGIWGNTEKPAFWDILPQITGWASKNNIRLHLTTRIIGNKTNDIDFDYDVIETADDFQKLDFLLALGGDGTILSAARAIGARETPMLGIHLGTLGFLAEVTVLDMFTALDRVANDDFIILERMVLKCTVNNGGKTMEFYALNDITIDRGSSHRLINSTLHSNGHRVARYTADGLIVSTPTGSTAYSLSAGGPIVMPNLDAIVVTPISPHTLTLRPIVMPDDSRLEITFPDNPTGGIALAVDGQVQETLDVDAVVNISKADYKTKMITFSDSNYFDILSKKMGWGRRGE
ncbi:MAG: NAD(+)/NADH kinase [Candidatus Marinimicrobia bacterium]|nr:NAD(+)/NADH kinase [Candidatus Neomarinimicrobiota bacterium]